MKRRLFPAFLLLALASKALWLATAAFSAEKGREPPTLEEAVTRNSSYDASVSETLKQPPLEPGAPSRMTAGLVLLLVFISFTLLGRQFFFTWHERIKTSREVAAEASQDPPRVKAPTPSSADGR